MIDLLHREIEMGQALLYYPQFEISLAPFLAFDQTEVCMSLCVKLKMQIRFRPISTRK